jgi:hypothetical protein
MILNRIQTSDNMTVELYDKLRLPATIIDSIVDNRIGEIDRCPPV